jgi:hypothetical protein
MLHVPAAVFSFVAKPGFSGIFRHAQLSPCIKKSLEMVLHL